MCVYALNSRAGPHEVSRGHSAASMATSDTWQNLPPADAGSAFSYGLGCRFPSTPLRLHGDTDRSPHEEAAGSVDRNAVKRPDRRVGERHASDCSCRWRHYAAADTYATHRPRRSGMNLDGDPIDSPGVREGAVRVVSSAYQASE